MQIKKTKLNDCYRVRLFVEEDGQGIGRASLVVIHNDLHEEPYGLLEDIFVKEEARKRGLGSKLLQAVIEEAKNIGCYKLIATTRSTKPEVQEWYLRTGFTDWGKEFRIDF